MWFFSTSWGVSAATFGTIFVPSLDRPTWARHKLSDWKIVVVRMSAAAVVAEQEGGANVTAGTAVLPATICRPSVNLSVRPSVCLSASVVRCPCSVTGVLPLRQSPTFSLTFAPATYFAHADHRTVLGVSLKAAQSTYYTSLYCSRCWA